MSITIKSISPVLAVAKQNPDLSKVENIKKDVQIPKVAKETSPSKVKEVSKSNNENVTIKNEAQVALSDIPKEAEVEYINPTPDAVVMPTAYEKDNENGTQQGELPKLNSDVTESVDSQFNTNIVTLNSSNLGMALVENTQTDVIDIAAMVKNMTGYTEPEQYPELPDGWLSKWGNITGDKVVIGVLIDSKQNVVVKTRLLVSSGDLARDRFYIAGIEGVKVVNVSPPFAETEKYRWLEVVLTNEKYNPIMLKGKNILK